MGRGTIEPRRLRKLLGQLCWLWRPNAGLSYFMAGSYQALDSGARWFTRSMARGLGMVLLFNAVAQSYPPDAHEGGMQQVPAKRDLLLFADAAPDGERFRVGLVGDRRFRRSIRCPAWVTSLQQAELVGIYYACKVAVYCSHRSVVIGTSYGYSNPMGYQTSDFRLLWAITPNPQPPKPPMIGLCPPPPNITLVLCPPYQPWLPPLFSCPIVHLASFADHDRRHELGM